MIQVQLLSATEGFDEVTSAVLREVEDFRSLIYNDGIGNATIGIGTNVEDDDNFLALTLREMGIITSALTTAEIQNRIKIFHDIIHNPANTLPNPGGETSPEVLQLRPSGSGLTYDIQLEN